MRLHRPLPVPRAGRFDLCWSAAMRSRAVAWALFLVSVLLLSLAATPYSRTADAALISLRLTLVIALSILVVHERWRKRHELPGKAALRNSDVGERFLQRCRRWYRGE
jgi:hypothetical protein